MIDPPHWQRLSALLDEALDLPEDQRAAWLDALCAREPGLADALRSLFQGLRTQPDSAPAAAFQQWLAPALAEPQLSTQPGQTLGPWRLEEKIGEGGMGQVWRATRVDGLYQGAAAIKLLRSDRAGPGLSARFARERHALARLNHPAIARLLDAGEAQGQVYLVLELVPGRTLSDWVRQHRPSLAQRVALLGRIAEAVEAAHAQLIVHRDLKPGNVMITDEGQPKLLDFGIAALLDDPAEPGELTRSTGRGLTVGYAAPEQIIGLSVGVAADVFSLGVILFELVTGALPFSQRRQPRPVMEMAVLEDPPHRLGAVTPDPEGPGAAPDGWRANGDLAAVIDKALRKDPAERYTGVRALIDDLDHWAAHRPVSARRGHWRHRSGLWLRRHALLAASVGPVGLSLALGLGLSLWQWQRAEQAAALARTREAQSQQLSSFMLGELADRLRPLGRLDILAGLGERSLTVLAEQPGADEAPLDRLHRAQALLVLGEVDSSRGRGQTATAVAALQAAEDLLRPLDGAAGVPADDWFATLGAVHFWRGQIAFDQGDLGPAAAQLERYRALSQRWLDQRPGAASAAQELAYAHASLAAVQLQRGQWGPARQSFEAVLADKRRRLAAAPTDAAARVAVANGLLQLADVLHVQGLEQDSLALLDEARALLDALQRQQTGQASWIADLARVEQARAARLADLGRHDEARRSAAEARRASQQVLAASPSAARWRLEALWGDTQHLLQAPPDAATHAARQALLADWPALDSDEPLAQALQARRALLEADTALAQRDTPTAQRLIDQAESRLTPLLARQPLKWQWSDTLAHAQLRRLRADPSAASCAAAAARLQPAVESGQAGIVLEAWLSAQACAQARPIAAADLQRLRAGGYQPRRLP
ncbi:serine/threonine protein kinase [Ideonella sp. 4Y16]|uniref:Serine/threonine protein kinase n=1 Tax=Ideonella alba TaxID=2824118 RepID=A0A941BG34_9BURK|nr:serine/threonine-protein kinase [Ideonella alba]MBQ0932686.1 serine/threonine protein kinase [Ideonella alba]MBQ0943456.1 serine/threonine protein kinase [Ideonella alba]